MEKTLTNLINDLTCTIPSLQRKLSAVNYKLYIEYDLNKSHIGVLFLLYREDNKTMSNIGKAFGISKPNATSIIDKLVTNGFAERIADQKDRRLVYIKLTGEGRKFVERCRENIENVLQKILSGYSSKELKLLEESLKNIKLLVSRIGDLNLE